MFVRSLVFLVGSVVAAAAFVPGVATRYLDATAKVPEAKVEKAAPARGGPKDEKQKARRKAKLEEELLTLHASLEELAAKLSDPALYADYAKVQALGEEMEKVQGLIQDKEAELAEG